MMRYKHLKPWTGLGKAFYIFSWANLIGAGVGWQIADKVAGLLPFLPWQGVYAVCIGAGLACTWPHQGRPLYSFAMIWLRWGLRRLLAPTSLEIWSRDYYQRPAAKTGAMLVSRQQTRTGRTLPTAKLPLPISTPPPTGGHRPARLPGTLPVRVLPAGQANTNGAHPESKGASE